MASRPPALFFLPIPDSTPQIADLMVLRVIYVVSATLSKLLGVAALVFLMAGIHGPTDRDVFKWVLIATVATAAPASLVHFLAPSGTTPFRNQDRIVVLLLLGTFLILLFCAALPGYLG